MAGQNFTDIWNQLRTEVQTRNSRLEAEYRAAWGDLSALLHDASIAVQNEVRSTIAPGQISALEGFLNDAGQRLAFDAIKTFRKIRPQERALAALDAHESGLEDLVRRLPETVVVSGRELVDALGPERFSRLSAYWMGRRERIDLPLRAVLQAHCIDEAERRAGLDGAFFLALSQVSLALLSPWQDLRRITLRGFAGQEIDEGEFDQEIRPRWLAGIKELEQRAAAALARLQAAAAEGLERLYRRMRKRGKRVLKADGKKKIWKRQERFSYWSRQQRAVRATIDLESHLGGLAAGLLQSASSAIDGLDAEHADVLDEIGAVTAWLEQALAGAPSGEFPPPSARLHSAGDRAGSWRHAAEVSARALLPSSVETVHPRDALPSWRAPWRHAEPLSAFLAGLVAAGQPIVAEGFRQTEAEHRSVIREIERAREVVTFSLETARAEPGTGAVIAREGMTNAMSLVTYQRQTAIAPRALAERHFVAAIASTLLASNARLELRRLGLWTQLASQSGTRAVRTLYHITLRQLAAGGQWVREAVRAFSHWVLLKVGWETPPITAEAPVIARGYLNDLLNLQASGRDLPLIYRRLFRLAPVEDPRFLIGREEEVSALTGARDLWQANRAVAVLLVGARGSGKTSLLNCAQASVFRGDDIVRGQFSERIGSRQGMREFLGRLLDAPPGTDVVEVLRKRRSVVILEELERTFLRRINGFDGLHELIGVVSATSRSTLWLLGLNQHSYAYLQAAVGLGQYFSHKINAMAIAPEYLKSAILLRHNLSGLRLQYPLVARSSPRVERMREMLGLQREAEDLYFEALYRQSQGIFRSAFELWQRYMERAEGGVLYMKHPIEPDAEPLIAQFTQDDLFTFQAILQHGSLTEGDHASIFECPVEKSRVRLDKLAALEYLEPDPSGPGLRVKPEAGRTVHTALHRLNLI